nr:hypothetical protein [uncultured Mucilaginibacter sp.]
MRKNFKLPPPAATDYFTYAVSFALVFDLGFLPGIQDGSQTAGMFLIMSVLMAILMVAFSFLFYYFTANKLKHIAGYCIMMYLFSEVIASLTLGRPCLFGLFTNQVVYGGTPYPDIYLFQKRTAFGLSCSFFIAAVICAVRKVLSVIVRNGQSPKAG